MNEEAGFLSAIRTAPADDTARQVYADWLDEQSDPHSSAKSAVLRLELQIRTGKWKATRLTAARTRLRKLSAALDPEWLAVVTRPELENCLLKFEYECPKEWGSLAATDQEHVRSCDACHQNVYYCTTVDEASRHAGQGHCVAVSVSQVRTPDDLQPRLLMGRFPLPGRMTRLGRVLPRPRKGEE